MFNNGSSQRQIPTTPIANCPMTEKMRMTDESPPPTMLNLVCDDCECSKFKNKPPGSMCICNLRTKTETLSSCQKFCLRTGNAYARKSMQIICNRNKTLNNNNNENMNNGIGRSGTRNKIGRVNKNKSCNNNNTMNNDINKCKNENGSLMNQVSNNSNNGEEQDELSNCQRPLTPPLSPFFDQNAAKWWWTLHSPDEELPRKKRCRQIPRNEDDNTAIITAGRNKYNMSIADTTLPGTDTDLRILRFEKQQQCNKYQNAMGQCQNTMNMNYTNSSNNNYYNARNRPIATPFSIMPNNCNGGGVMNCGCNNNTVANLNRNLNGQNCRPQTVSMGLNNNNNTNNSNPDGVSNSNKMCNCPLNNPTQNRPNDNNNNNNNAMLVNGIKTMMSGNNNMMVDSNDRHMNMMMEMNKKNTITCNGNVLSSTCNCPQN